MDPEPRVDVLVVTALKEEYDAAEAVLGQVTSRHGTGGPEPYATAAYPAPGGTLTVALTRPTQMGGRGTAPIATTLVNRLRPVCLAMCGVCAGNPRDTAPGDVVVASPAYEWDEGKWTGEEFRGDHRPFPLDVRWERAAQDFDPAGLPSHGAATDQDAAVWFLERLHRDQDPRKHPARGRYFTRATWSTGLDRLRASGLITWRENRWTLTGDGRAHIERILYHDVYGPERLPFGVLTGPMASGSAVMQDERVWDRLGVAQRRILAVEMEAATVATVAHQRQVPHWLVAKGVMDHAGLDKDDRFKGFAARASAEVLFTLLGDLMAPAGAAPTRPVAGVPAAVRREVLRGLTYDWPDLADVVGVPSSDMRRFRPGDEAREVWDWLAGRGRIGDLPAALDEIGRPELARLLRSYT